MSKENIWQPAWQQDAVAIEKRDLVHDGFYKVRRYQLRHKTFSGNMSASIVREQMFRQDASAVLLFDPKRDELVLVEQFRMGVLEHRDDSPWLLEIVAGLIEPGEDPRETIHREAIEETGCQIKKLIQIGEFYNSPGGFAEKTWIYCGIVDASQAHQEAGVADEHEDIRVHRLDAKTVLKTFSTWVTSASTVIALQWFKEWVR